MNDLVRFRTACLLSSAVMVCGIFLATAPRADAQEPLIAGAAEPAAAQPDITEPPVESESAPGVPAVTVTPEAVPSVTPDETELTTPGITPLPETEVSVIPALPITEEPDENLFFDAESLVPTGEMGVKGGPSKVNPRLQPASKFIVVTKNAGGSSQQAQLVSAERAVKLGHYDAALEIYNRLYEKNKRDPNVLLGRATALQHLGQTDSAVQAYEELLEYRPKNVEAQINMLGLMGQRYPAVALRRLTDLRDENPDHVGVAAQIAVVQAELGQYDDALKYLGIASSMEPNNAAHVFNMAVIADRTGAKKEAVGYYERALELDTIYGGGRTVPRESIYERLAQIR